MDRGDGEEIAHELVSFRETKEPRRVEEAGMGISPHASPLPDMSLAFVVRAIPYPPLSHIPEECVLEAGVDESCLLLPQSVKPVGGKMVYVPSIRPSPSIIRAGVNRHLQGVLVHGWLLGLDAVGSPGTETTP